MSIYYHLMIWFIMNAPGRLKKKVILMSLTDINIYTLKQVRSKRRRYDFEGRRITSPSVCYTTLESILDLQAEPVEASEDFGSESRIQREALIRRQ
jgi:hypothetical protein